MIVTTTNSVEGRPVREYLGLVTGETILGANILRDFMAGIRDVLGKSLGSSNHANVVKATLKALLKNAKATKGGYSGKITVGQARKVSPWFRATHLRDDYPAKVLKTQISWKLSVDAKGLPTRLVTTFPLGVVNGTPKKSETISVDTRYTGWGTKASIKAPTRRADAVQSASLV